MKNDYYYIAIEDLKYLQATLDLPYYNNISIAAQQITEKMLKSVAERVSTNCEPLLRSHNLRALYDLVYSQYPVMSLNRGDLSMLKDYYFDAKYPGDNSVTVTKAECIQCLDIMYGAVDFVHAVRRQLGLGCEKVDKKLPGNSGGTLSITS